MTNCLKSFVFLLCGVGAVHATSFNSGMRTISFTVGGATYKGNIWYPSSDRTKSFNYGGITSQVALNGKMAPGSHPVLIFSHGDTGCATQSVFITESLAQAGYVVAAVNYQDANTDCGGNGGQMNPPFTDDESWNDQTVQYRLTATEGLLGFLNSSNQDQASFLFQSMDFKRLGFSGHSLGGYTGGAMAGSWPTWIESRFKAALLLSPYVAPFDDQNPISSVKIPVMLQTGTADVGIAPTLPDYYDGALANNKYQITFQNASHFVWTNTTCSKYSSTAECLKRNSVAASIVKYSRSFVDAYIGGNSCAVDTTTNSDVSAYISEVDAANCSSTVHPAVTLSVSKLTRAGK